MAAIHEYRPRSTKKRLLCSRVRLRPPPVQVGTWAASVRIIREIRVPLCEKSELSVQSKYRPLNADLAERNGPRGLLRSGEEFHPTEPNKSSSTLMHPPTTCMPRYFIRLIRSILMRPVEPTTWMPISDAIILRSMIRIRKNKTGEPAF